MLSDLLGEIIVDGRLAHAVEERLVDGGNKKRELRRAEGQGETEEVDERTPFGEFSQEKNKKIIKKKKQRRGSQRERGDRG